GNGHGQFERACELALAALESMVLFEGRGTLAAKAGNGDRVVGRVHLDIRLEHAWQLRGEDERVGSLVHVDGGSPAALSGRITVQALLNRQQIAQRIPSGKRHTAS